MDPQWLMPGYPTGWYYCPTWTGDHDPVMISGSSQGLQSGIDPQAGQPRPWHGLEPGQVRTIPYDSSQGLWCPGVVHWLGTDGGRRSWHNPLMVHASSVWTDSYRGSAL